MLYKRQKIAYQDLLNGLQSTDMLSNQRLVLAGEPGVGKTYVASAVSSQFEKALIIVPSGPLHKWKTVLAEFIHQQPVIYSPKKENNIKITTKYVIVRHNQLDTFFASKTASEWLTDLDLIIMDEFQELIQKENILNAYIFAKALYKDFLKPKQEKGYSLLETLWEKQNIPTLFLSGSAFSLSKTKLAMFCNAFWPNLYQGDRYDFRPNYLDTDGPISGANALLTIFDTVWQYVAVTLNLSETQALAKRIEKIHQTLKINTIELTAEELAYYNLIDATSPTKTHAAANNAIDMFNGQNFTSVKQHSLVWPTTSGRKRTIANTYQSRRAIGFSINAFSLQDSAKYRKCKEILANHDDRTLILVNDQEVMNTLCNTLNADNITTVKLSSRLRKEFCADWINHQLSEATDTQVVLADPTRISVGIDITNADQLIWYQIPNDSELIFQTQKRIYRLSSRRNSVVHYLIYKDTYQDELIHSIAASFENNNAAFGHHTSNALTKLNNMLIGKDLDHFVGNNDPK